MHKCCSRSALGPIAVLLIDFACWKAGIVSAQSTTAAPNVVEGECIDGPSMWYEGTRNYTASGIPCQRWDVTTPHTPVFTPPDGGAHNHCRNPDHDQLGTWCYTTNATVKWEHCKIPKCPDDSLVAWTSFNVDNRTARALSFHADPEIVRGQAGAGTSVNVTPLFATNRTPSEYWALTSDYKHQKIFFLDYRSSHLGVYDLKTNTTQTFLEGMGHGIESLAHDWVTSNLYWTDSEQRYIMASDTTFRHYTPIFRTGDAAPYALALHAKKRLLYFSTYKAVGSKILFTDLAGKNATTIFEFPNVFDVTGITIDYVDNKLYWTDFTGFGSLVLASNLDGSNKTRIYFTASSILWGISSYTNYIYVTDVRTRHRSEGRYFFVWWVSKGQTTDRRLKVGNYRLQEKPRGITVLSKNEEYSIDESSRVGGCDVGAQCDHLCLPRVDQPRLCACSIGYELVGETRCAPNLGLLGEERILVSDIGQGAIFQIPLHQPINKTKFSIVPIDTNTHAYALAINMKTSEIYWTDINDKSIRRASWDGSRTSTIITDRESKTIAVDSNAGNLFFADETSRYIYTADSHGTYSSPIMKSSDSDSSIRKITLDLTNRWVYWSDSKSTANEGQIRRMRYDGSDQQLVFDGLHWPEPIAIDYQGSRFFFAEAKKGVIFGFPIYTMMNVNGSMPSENLTMTFAVSNVTRRSSMYIYDITVLNNYMYLYDGVTNSVEKFSLSQGLSSLKSFGPSDFYRVHSFATFSISYYRQFLERIPEPCATRSPPCRHICVALDNTQTVCLCDEGYRVMDETDCVENTAGRTTPPRLLSCPLDQTLTIDSCATYALVRWNHPVWENATQDLTVTGPTNNFRNFTEGTAAVTYTATDSAGNVATCSFAITVTRTSCQPLETIDAYTYRRGGLQCDQGRSYFALSCVRPGHVISSNRNPAGATNSSEITNRTAAINVYCQHGGYWVPPMAELVCVALPTTVAPTTTPIATTTVATAAATTTTQPAAPGSSPLPTTTTTPPPAIATDAKIASSAATVIPVQETTKKSIKAPSAALAGGLSAGDIAAIVVISIVVVVVVAVIGYVSWRRRMPTATNIFPVFWRNPDDRETLDNNAVDGTHSYSVFQ